MSDFDPANLGPYRPYRAATLADVAQHIAYMSKQARIRAWEEVLACEIYDEGERAQIRDMIAWYRQHDPITTRSTWVFLRDLLVTGRMKAYAVNDRGVRAPIDQELWALDAAIQVFSAGSIDIPMYHPRGSVYVPVEMKSEAGLDAWHISYENYRYDSYFKVISPKQFKDQFISFLEANKVAIGSDLSIEEQIDEKFQATRGKRKTFDIKTFLIEAMRIIANERIDFSEYGAKKKFTARVRAAYLVSKGKDDLPDDDTLIRDLSSIWKDREAPQGRIIPHDPE